MTPQPELLPEGAQLLEWKLTPDVYTQHGDGWREWGPGEWDSEPDRVEWRVAGSPHPRLAIRNRFGAWCGYVGVPEGHPLFGKSWDDEAFHALDVHGGLTYGEMCAGLICHVPQPGEPDHVWWLGFDCAHSGDQAPGLRKGTIFEWESYKPVGYVIAETEKLARQVEEAAQ